MRNRATITLALGMTLTATIPTAGQSNDQFWRDTWFWGAQGGAYIFSAGGNQEVGFGVGGHWFITQGKTALNLAFDQLYFTTSNVTVGAEPVTFSRGQRVQASVYAMPSTTGLQVYLGGGFAIQHITNSLPSGPFATPQAQFATEQQIEAVATKAFAILGGGIQWRWLSKWVVFGQYQFQPSTNDFLIGSAQHVIQGGVRYALTKSKEVVAGR